MRVPHPGHHVLTGRQYATAVGAELGRDDAVVMRQRRRRGGTRRDVPDVGAARIELGVANGRDEPGAVRAEGGMLDHAGVRPGADALAGLGVPQAGRLVTTCRGDAAAVGAEGGEADGILVRQSGDELAGRDIPDGRLGGFAAIGPGADRRCMRAPQVVKRRRPSPRKATWTTAARCPSRGPTAAPVRASQSWAVASVAPLTINLPSGLKASARTGEPCTIGAWSRRPLAASRRMTLPNSVPTATVAPSGLSARAAMRVFSAHAAVDATDGARCQSRAARWMPAVTSRSPSGLKAAA